MSATARLNIRATDARKPGSVIGMASVMESSLQRISWGPTRPREARPGQLARLSVTGLFPGRMQ
jgi:hypothetical protein